MTMMALRLPIPTSSSLQALTLALNHHHHHHHNHRSLSFAAVKSSSPRSRRRHLGPVLVGKEETEVRVQFQDDGSPEDLECIAQIQRVLELLKKNRDMLFSEVKLTIGIEDPREIERRRLLGIEDPDAPTREDLAAALDDVNEGRIPENRVALRLLAEEMSQWPNLEVEATKKKPSKSLYARATDTGIDPKVAAKRLNVDWDTAAEIEDTGDADDVDVPSAVGFGALYLVSAFPIIIGVSVVLILFFNSLQ